MKIEATITLEDLPVEVTGTHVPHCPGLRDGRGGPPLEPDDEEDMEDVKVELAVRKDRVRFDKHGNALVDIADMLDPDTHAELRDDLLDAYRDREQALREDYTDAREEA